MGLRDQFQKAQSKVSINSPSGEGGEGNKQNREALVEVSINSPSGEGGECYKLC